MPERRCEAKRDAMYRPDGLQFSDPSRTAQPAGSSPVRTAQATPIAATRVVPVQMGQNQVMRALHTAWSNCGRNKVSIDCCDCPAGGLPLLNRLER